MDDRDLAIADDDVAGWRQALEQPAAPQLPTVADQDYGVEDFGRPGEQPHGNVPGIPVSADDYHLPTVPGFEWSEGDRPNLESFLEVAHTDAAADAKPFALVCRRDRQRRGRSRRE
jgi:hypothetical protein